VPSKPYIHHLDILQPETLRPRNLDQATRARIHSTLAPTPQTQTCPLKLPKYSILTSRTQPRCAAFMGLSLIREAGAQNLSCLADLSPSEFASGYEGAGVLPENMQVETLNPMVPHLLANHEYHLLRDPEPSWPHRLNDGKVSKILNNQPRGLNSNHAKFKLPHRELLRLAMIMHATWFPRPSTISSS